MSTRPNTRSLSSTARKASVVGRKVDRLALSRKSTLTALRRELLRKVVSAATERVELMEDAEISRLLRQVEASGTVKKRCA